MIDADVETGRRQAAIRQTLDAAVLSHPPTPGQLERLTGQLLGAVGVTKVLGEVP